MIITFLNKTFLPFSTFNDGVYGLENITMNEILAVVSRYTSFFDDKSCNSFVQWCIIRNVCFMKAAVPRKKTTAEEEKVGFRSLHVIKREFIGKKLMI